MRQLKDRHGFEDRMFEAKANQHMENSNNHKRWYHLATQWHLGNVMVGSITFYDFCCYPQYNLSVESNQNVESKRIKWGVQNRKMRSQTFGILTVLQLNMELLMHFL